MGGDGEEDVMETDDVMHMGRRHHALDVGETAADNCEN